MWNYVFTLVNILLRREITWLWNHFGRSYIVSTFKNFIITLKIKLFTVPILTLLHLLRDVGYTLLNVQWDWELHVEVKMFQAVLVTHWKDYSFRWSRVIKCYLNVLQILLNIVYRITINLSGLLFIIMHSNATFGHAISFLLSY